MLEVGVHAATDVTGFGLLGHLQNMLQAADIAAEIRAAAVPLLPRAREAAGPRRFRYAIARQRRRFDVLKG